MKKAIVIGSGFGGLASAVRLLAKGYAVEIFEANSQIGGRARFFEKDNFIFDGGPTVITAPYLIAELFELVNKNPQDYYQLVNVDPFYRVYFPDGTKFDYVGDEQRLLDQIAKISPKDVEGYKKLAAHAERIFDIGYTQLADQSFDKLSEMLRVVPQMLRLKNYYSVYQLVSKYIKDERLRQVFSFQPLLIGGNPFNCTSIYLLIHWLERKWGVHYPLGGTTQLIKALGKLIQDIGGKIHLNAPVDKIHVNDHKKATGVESNGDFHKADLVVSNADPSMVYSTMIDSKHRKKHSDKKIHSKEQSMSLFVAYFGTKKKYPDIPQHSIILGPRYQGLLNDIFKTKTLAQDFSLYLHAPSRTDENMAPPGHEAFYVLSPVPNNKSNINWDKVGPEYMERIMNYLDSHHLPGLFENLATSFYITPDYFQKELRSMDGSAFGIEPRLTQSAYFRYHNKSEEIKGLYFVGANTHPGAGIPGVLSSAKVLDNILSKATELHL